MKEEIDSSFGKELIMNEEMKKIPEVDEKDSGNVDVKDSLSLIKSTIDKTKYNFNCLFTHLISFGIVSLFFNFLLIRNAYRRNDNIEAFIQIGFPVFALLLFIPYLKRRKMLKKTQGDYTLSLYSLWGYALFLPIAVKLSRVIFTSKVVAYYDLYTSILTLAFLLTAILITGILIKNKPIIVLGIASPIAASLYMILKLSFGVSFKVNTFVYHSAFIVKQTVILTVIFTALYLAFAIICKVKGEAFGNEGKN